LYEAPVTVNAVRGTVTPVLPFFNARSENGANYRVLANVFTPQGVSGAPLPQGGSSTGKLYFDIVGDVPNSVVYNDGSHDVLGWIQVPNGPTEGSPGGSSSAATGGGASAEGVTGSTGPNFTGPSDTANGSGGSGIEGNDEGSGGGGSGSSGGGTGAGG
jgi:hypothetical protein